MAPNRQQKVLIAGTEHVSLKILSENLAPFFNLKSISDLSKMFPLAREFKPNLLLLFYGGLNRAEYFLLKRFLEDTDLHNIPVVVASRTMGVLSRIKVLEAGASDCITGRFDGRELYLRICARLRRRKPREEKKELRSSNLILNLNSYQVFVNNIEVKISPTQMRILKVLLENRHMLLPRMKFIEIVYGEDVTFYGRSLDSLISRLRGRLSGYNGRIIAVKGRGYIIEDFDSEEVNFSIPMKTA